MKFDIPFPATKNTLKWFLFQVLIITDNENLSSCDVQSVCDYLASPNSSVSILWNAPGCNSQQEVEEACGNVPCLPQGIIFTIQAQIDSFQVNYPGCTEIEGYVEIYAIFHIKCMS